MSKGFYFGVDEAARKVKKMYVGVGGIARKVKKAYIGVGGVARQFYSAEFLSYDGVYSVSQVEYEGKTCDLYTLTGSGILTLSDDALVWMCGGGGVGRAGGGTGSQNGDIPPHYAGGGGAGAYAVSGELGAGDFTITIASGDNNGSNRKTQIISGDTALFTANGGTLGSRVYYGGIGGTGGGGAYGLTGSSSALGAGGSGDGISKYPFGLTDLKAHCAGGSGGVYLRYDESSYRGGAGGTNGGKGGTPTEVGVSVTASARPGGSYGGGNGAGFSGNGYSTSTGTIIAATAGSFYGAGGGGGARVLGVSSNKQSGGCAGYQGVVYILDVNGGTPI